MRGLPVGQGEVWHDDEQRRLLIGLAAAAFLPLLGLVLMGSGIFSLAWYYGWVVAPTLGLVAVGAAYARKRHRQLFRRIGVGLGAGVFGVLAYDVAHALWVSVYGGAYPVWAGFVPEAVPAWAAFFNHWVVAGALWGMAYTLLAGKARWYYGVAYGIGLWALVGLVALVAPQPGMLLSAVSWDAFASLLVGHMIFGTVLGLLSDALVPDARRSAKIIFLRDYQSRVKERQ